MNIKKIILGIISITIALNPYYIYAEEISVTGNGSGSANNVNISSENTSEVKQENTAEITNDVNVDANTGNNQANENNGGEVSIETGDVNASSTITNEGINQNFAEQGCCAENISAKIGGNGPDSTNSIDYSSNNNTSVVVNNNAVISNNVNGSANTGNNEANNNNVSSVSITTGDIKATDVIRNKSINISDVQASTGNGGSISLLISDNGPDSNNSITFANNNNVDVDINNDTDIENNSEWYLNTGGNKANGNNNADVKIATGDIVFTSTIENTDINISIVDVDCCDENKGGPDNPPDSEPPPPPPPPGGNGCVSNCGGGKSDNPSSNPSNGVGGASVLPITGNFSLIFLAIANVLMFFLGGYLRLRSGRAPNLAI